MTKLEQKLIELGYEKYICADNFKLYIKTINRYDLEIAIKNNEEIIHHRIGIDIFLCEQEEIDEIQQAFNQLQQDLEVLKNEL